MKVGADSRIYLLLYKAGFLRKLFVVLIPALEILSGCNNTAQKENKATDKTLIDARTDSSRPEDKSSDTFNWTKKEQDQFMNDCIAGSEGEEIAEESLKNFCQCMLSEAQKYYPRYHHLEKKSNEEHDKAILEKCAGMYLTEE